MKSTYTLISLFVTYFSSILSVTAQDWSPLRFSDQTYAYRYSHNATFRYIRVEEQSASGTDSLFHLNTIYTPCDTCGRGDFILRNQPHFLQKEIRKTDPGVYHFQDTGSFVIHALAGLGETWLFDTMTNVSATVASIERETLWDQTDSIKTIALSSGETIRLSKHHGIVEFPAFGSGETYTLEGLQGKQLGIDLPTYKDFYDFNIGDEFQVFAELNTAELGFVDSVMQYTIVDKRIQGNQISYDIEGIGHLLSVYTYICCDTLDDSSFEINKTLTFIDEPEHLLNHLFTRFPMSSIEGFEGFGPNPSPVVFLPTFSHIGGLTGSLTAKWPQYYVFPDDSSDIGLTEGWIENYFFDWDLPETQYFTTSVEQGVGLIHLLNQPNGFEDYAYSYGISALKRDGQVYGEWISNILASGEEDPSEGNKNPICNTHQITFYSGDQIGDRGFLEVSVENSQSNTVSIFGINGQKISGERFVETSHTLILPSYLAKGVYVIQLQGEDSCITRRKISVR